MQDGHSSWNDIEDTLGLNEGGSGFDTENLQKMSNIIKLTLSPPTSDSKYEKLDLEGVLDMTRQSGEKLRQTKILLEERELRTQEFIRRTTDELRAAQDRIAKAEERIAAAEAMEGMAEARLVSAESWIVHIQDTLSECFACEK